MRLLQIVVHQIWKRWLTQFLYYALGFWSIEVIFSLFVQWEKSPERKIFTALLVAGGFTLIERLKSLDATEARFKRREIGLIFWVALLIVAIALVVTKIASSV